MSKDTNKRQLSISVDTEKANELDQWIAWQKENRGYEVDRSHVFNVLLSRFLEINKIPLSNQGPSLDFDIE